mgnify:CR=1 FL=1
MPAPEAQPPPRPGPPDPGGRPMRPNRRPKAESQGEEGDRDPAPAPTPDGYAGRPPPIRPGRGGSRASDLSPPSSSASRRSSPPLRTRQWGASGPRIAAVQKLRLGLRSTGSLQGAAAKPTVRRDPPSHSRTARWPSPRTSLTRSPVLDLAVRRLKLLLGSVGATSSPPKHPWVPSAAGFPEARRLGAEH